ncbi:transporter, SSS family [Granulicella pectinivorans]|uniref:Transporter, SSS family n=1 Tax=Granulicella pectinivorans TaxID=474950 RepID=A0A1I6MY87_9BACT|nr:sodium/solute symporter [Granulicella pectinivorans]SFS20619.1 transporter, SSS family [Granulicella pectinivorans]
MQLPVSATRLHPLDLVLIVLYLVGITLFGLRFRTKKVAGGAPAQTLKSYFLADNTIPWWAIALSIVSAETSTLTIISIPGVAFAGDFGFLQVVLGYMIGRIVVAMLFLPKYFDGKMLTAYQLINQRFGSTLHKVTAGLFLLTRAAAEGVRVFAVSIVVGIAIGTGDLLSIAIITILTLLYTFEGGMAAVIWTDVVQMAIYVGGTVVALITLGNHVPGGWTTIHAVAGAAGKFHWLDFSFNLTSSYTFWAGAVGGSFLTMASHGTDQLMVQRMLAARSLKESRLALLSSGVVIFIQFAFFLLIGAGLYVFYSLRPTPFAGGPAGLISPDRIFPSFIVHEMPTGIAGLLVAAILAAAMSNLSAAINSLSSTTVVDFYLPWRKRFRGDSDEEASRKRNLVAKLSTVAWAGILFSAAAYTLKVGGKGHVVETGLSIASVAYGALLGVFLLGTLTRYATQTGAMIGMVAGFAFNVVFFLQSIQILPNPIGPITLPKVAFTWYVFLGALVTFVTGSLFSLIFRKQSLTKATAAVVVLAVAGLSANAQTPDFTPVSTLMNDAIAAHKLPGAVVQVGHNGKVLFTQAYGVRKYDGEPGLDGQPSPAEPMTVDTIFDMASLTKCLATATAIMQLYEEGKIQFDDPVAKYLPDFAANGKEAVTIRMLLTHYSGLPEDVSIKDPWGLVTPDKAEGIKRAMESTLYGPAGHTFKYSDINFITLGALVEKLSGQPEDVYVAEHIFKPLGMTDTYYHPYDKTCGPVIHYGANVAPGPKPIGRIGVVCLPHTWSPYSLDPRTAPTAHDDESKTDPTLNPDWDHLLRGTVHDPTTRRMGGVAGHAGVFSTTHDVGLYAAALLEKLLHNTGPFPLKQSTLKLMTTPEQPATASTEAVIFNPDGTPTRGIPVRAFGWDINTAFSRPRGAIFPIGSFGHTGFTGTTLWMDPTSDTYVVLLSNAVHPRVGGAISQLRGLVATAVAKALGLTSPATSSTKTLTGIDVLEQSHYTQLTEAAARHNNRLNLGILTNVAGTDSKGRRTIDVIATEASKAVPQIHLTTLFAAEHGLSAKQETTAIKAEFDDATHLPITSLYGPKPSDRRPTHDQLKDLDAVLVDFQDVGNRFWTFDTAMAYFLEASAAEKRDYHHDLEIIVLDHPNPTSGTDFAVQGPISDPGRQAYIDYTPLPARHGMTIGELARYYNTEATPTAQSTEIFAAGAKATSAPATKGIGAHLTVVTVQNWTRDQYLDQTGIVWNNPSPNLRSVNAATLYPGIGLFETSNLSVGRGTATPFEHFGAPYLKPEAVLACLVPRNIPGIAFSATTMPIQETPDHYPYHGQTIPGIKLTITDRTILDTPELGMEIITCVHKLYPTEFNLDRTIRIIANADTLAALTRGDDPRAIAASWKPSLDAFRAKRIPYLLYQ